MIAFWNRKEVYLANTLQKFNEVRELLEAKGINYTYRVDSSLPSKSREFFAIGMGRSRESLGINMDYANLYYVYVHKKDYDLACAVIGKRI